MCFLSYHVCHCVYRRGTCYYFMPRSPRSLTLMRPCNPLGSNLPAVPAKLCPSQVLFSTCGLRAIPLTGGDASGSSLYTALKAAEFGSLPLARASTCESFPLWVCTCSSPCGWNTWYHKNRSSSEVCFAQRGGRYPIHIRLSTLS